MSSARIMLVDDELNMRILIEQLLKSEGYDCCVFSSAKGALAGFAEYDPNLVILDVMMPEMDGFVLCEAMRSKGLIVPILFLSARGDVVDKDIGFNAGGDEYLTKPFMPDELLIRIKAHLRMNSRKDKMSDLEKQTDVIKYKDLELRISQLALVVEGKKINLTPKEFQIVYFLAKHSGEIYTANQLYTAIWDEDIPIDTSSIPVLIRRIRQKIEKNPSKPEYIQTVLKGGYRFGL